MSDISQITLSEEIDITQVVRFDPLSSYLIVVEIDESLASNPEAIAKIEQRIKQVLSPIFKETQFEVMLTDCPIQLTSYRFKPVYE